MKICTYIYILANILSIAIVAIIIIKDDFSLTPLLGIALIFGIGGVIIQLVGITYTVIIGIATSWKIYKYIDFNSGTLIIVNVGVVLTLLAHNIKDKDFVIWLLLVNVAVMCSILREMKEDEH